MDKHETVNKMLNMHENASGKEMGFGQSINIYEKK